MSTDRIKKAILAGWDAMSDSYQAETRISTDDVHYGPLAPGERELRLLGDVRGQRVLELACGAAQNSIALAKWGARVAALDFSPRQLEKARMLAAREKVAVDLVRGDMERLTMFRDAIFGTVLSSFGWEFVLDLGACLRECHRVLRDGGLLVVCTIHPLSAFEWDEGLGGVIVTDYFNPPVEVWNETKEPSGHAAVTLFHTVEETFGLLTSAGFDVERIVEPRPHPIHEMSESERRGLPFSGAFWEDQYDRLRRVPFSIVYLARKKG